MADLENYRFEFRGSGSEYFRIWIVNVALTILTLGVYSAWAKVRSRRYFYGNTVLAGASFDYLADPLKILKGRLIVAGVFIPTAVVANFVPLVELVFTLAIFLVFPWLFVRSRRFNAVNSAYRNVRFFYAAGYGKAVAVFIGLALLIPLTAGLIYPYFVRRRFKLMLDHHSFGTTALSMNAPTARFYANYLVALALYVGLVVLGGIGTGILSALRADETLTPFVGLFFLVLALAFIGALLWVATLLQVRNLNTVWNSTRLGQNVFRSQLRAGRLYWISLVNVFAVIVSFGLLVPWAQVRVARYRAACLSLELADSFEHFLAAETDRVEALGEEFADALDFDFGL